MKFSTYLKQFKSGAVRAAEIKRLADGLNVSCSYIRGLALGLHHFPAKHAIKLCKLTHNQISLHELAPDIYPVNYKLNTSKSSNHRLAIDKSQGFVDGRRRFVD